MPLRLIASADILGSFMLMCPFSLFWNTKGGKKGSSVVTSSQPVGNDPSLGSFFNSSPVWVLVKYDNAQPLTTGSTSFQGGSRGGFKASPSINPCTKHGPTTSYWLEPLGRRTIGKSHPTITKTLSSNLEISTVVSDQRKITK